ncbi:MAG: hypothetical protein IKN64_03540 [Desulfovibrio sp.]|nr:hypothetical protein [Desulfovibrio sp.]
MRLTKDNTTKKIFMPFCAERQTFLPGGSKLLWQTGPRRSVQAAKALDRRLIMLWRIHSLKKLKKFLKGYVF